jgi:predicted amidohydrolase YtcJ
VTRGLLLVALGCWSLQAQPPDLILVNGRIFTGAPNQSRIEALAITGQRISATGTSKSISHLAGPATQVIDLQGRLVIPGLNDAHIHFFPEWVGKKLDFSGNNPTCAEVLRAVKTAVAGAKPLEVITGVFGPSAFFSPDCGPAQLDGIAPSNPILLRTFTPHAAMMNRSMARYLRTNEKEPPVMGRFFGKNMRSAQWDGVVHEFAAIELYARLIDHAKEPAGLSAVLEAATHWGITTIQLMSAPTDPEHLITLLGAAPPPIRVRVIPFVYTTAAGRQRPVYPPIPPNISDRVRVDGVKWLLDGTPIEHSAAMSKPYADDPAWSGAINYSDSEIRAILEESRKTGTQLVVHAIGDRTTKAFLSLMEHSGGAGVWGARRVRIEHCNGITSDLLPQVRNLGVVVVLNPTHVSLAGQPNRTMLDAGIPLAIGSDAEGRTPGMNPFRNMKLICKSADDPAPVKLTREEAIAAYTRTSAYAEFEEREKGTLEAGKLADIAVLSQDILNCPLEDLLKTQSVLTIVGGKIVYRTLHQ